MLHGSKWTIRRTPRITKRRRVLGLVTPALKPGGHGPHKIGGRPEGDRVRTPAFKRPRREKSNARSTSGRSSTSPIRASKSAHCSSTARSRPARRRRSAAPRPVARARASRRRSRPRRRSRDRPVGLATAPPPARTRSRPARPIRARSRPASRGRHEHDLRVRRRAVVLDAELARLQPTLLQRHALGVPETGTASTRLVSRRLTALNPIVTCLTPRRHRRGPRSPRRTPDPTGARTRRRSGPPTRAAARRPAARRAPPAACRRARRPPPGHCPPRARSRDRGCPARPTRPAAAHELQRVRAGARLADPNESPAR